MICERLLILCRANVDTLNYDLDEQHLPFSRFFFVSQFDRENARRLPYKKKIHQRAIESSPVAGAWQQLITHNPVQLFTSLLSILSTFITDRREQNDNSPVENGINANHLEEKFPDIIVTRVIGWQIIIRIINY